MNRVQLAAYINTLIQILINGLVLLIPLFFIGLTTEPFELPKLALLVGFVMVLLVLWSFKWVISGQVTITRTPLDIPLLLILVIAILSTFFSDSRIISIFGNYPTFHGSLISIVSYILLYFILVSNIKTHKQVVYLLYTLFASASLVSIVTLSSYFGLYLPLNFAKIQSFTPTGQTFATVAFLNLLLPIVFTFIIRKNPFVTTPLAIVIATLFAIVIGLVGSTSNQVIAVLSLILVLFLSPRNELKHKLPLFFVPIVVSLLLIIISSFQFGNINNPLFSKREDFKKLNPVQLSFKDSWTVSASAVRDEPWLGTGPATFLFNFTAYKPVSINLTPMWNLRFVNSYNEYFQVFATLGILGMLAFLFLTIVLLNLSWMGLRDRMEPLTQTLAISVLVVIALMLVHTSTIVTFVMTIMILVMFIAINKHKKAEELSIGIKASKKSDNFHISDFKNFNTMEVGDILPFLIFVAIVIMSIPVFYQSYKVLAADIAHKNGLEASLINLLTTHNDFVKAETLNPYIDTYHLDLTQTNFALANAIASSKAPTESSPSGSLTDQDKQNIQTLLAQAISEAQIATTISPRSAQNWEVLGSIYRQITGVAENALQFSLNAYGQAIERDPLNPILRLNIGGIYYANKNYDLAVRFFTDAVNLKPDYANAYYNLAVALKDKGNLEESQMIAEKTVSLLDPKSADYKVATNFLKDLRQQIATGSAGGQTPPAAQNNSALGQENLPEVLDLPKPSSVSTPSAIPGASPKN